MNRLIIAVGNALRGDDGVGERVIELLEANAPPSTRLLHVHTLLPEHAAELVGCSAVMFVDADVTTAVVVVERFEEVRTSLHGFGPAAIVRFAYALGFEGEAWICRLPAPSMGAGPGLSQVAEAGANETARRLAQWAQSDPMPPSP